LHAADAGRSERPVDRIETALYRNYAIGLSENVAGNAYPLRRRK